MFVIVVSWSCLPFFFLLCRSSPGRPRRLLVVFFFLIFSFDPALFGLVVSCSCLFFFGFRNLPSRVHRSGIHVLVPFFFLLCPLMCMLLLWTSRFFFLCPSFPVHAVAMDVPFFFLTPSSPMHAGSINVIFFFLNCSSRVHPGRIQASLNFIFILILSSSSFHILGSSLPDLFSVSSCAVICEVSLSFKS